MDELFPDADTTKVPDDIVEQAAEAAYEHDKLMVVGFHPYFGWVYRDADDDGAMAEMMVFGVVGSEGLRQ